MIRHVNMTIVVNKTVVRYERRCDLLKNANYHTKGIEILP